MRRLEKTRATGEGPAALGRAHNRTSANPAIGRKEAQGIAVQRAPCQPAPEWERPPGADAADDLARALRRWGRI
jgi:hypothetical protein